MHVCLPPLLSLQDLSSLTRDQTWAHGSESPLTTGPILISHCSWLLLSNCLLLRFSFTAPFFEHTHTRLCQLQRNRLSTGHTLGEKHFNSNFSYLSRYIPREVAIRNKFEIALVSRLVIHNVNFTRLWKERTMDCFIKTEWLGYMLSPTPHNFVLFSLTF